MQWQEELAQTEVEEATRARAEFAGAFFKSMFDPIDILFFVLAVGTAFRIASGGANAD